MRIKAWLPVWMAAVTILLLLQAPVPVQALKCVKQPDLEQNLENYDGVVLAEVESITASGNHMNILELKVEQSYKGISERGLSVTEHAEWGTSAKGETYLFFLQEDGGQWEHPLCPPTQLKEEAGETLRQLQGKGILLKEEETSKAVPLGNLDSSDVASSPAGGAEAAEGDSGEDANSLAISAEGKLSSSDAGASSFVWAYAAVPLGIVGFAVFGIIRIRKTNRRN